MRCASRVSPRALSPALANATLPQCARSSLRDNRCLRVITVKVLTHYSRSKTAQVDFATWVAQEEREMANDDPAKQNLRACIERAHFKLRNNGSLDELHSQVVAALG